MKLNQLLSSYKDKDLSEKHRMVLRLDLMGKSNSSIAAITGYATNTVSQIKTQEAYKVAKRKLKRQLDKSFVENFGSQIATDPVRSQLEESKVRALEILVTLMENAQSENVRQSCAKDILDRAGYKPKDVLEHKAKIDISDSEMRSNIESALEDLRGKNG